MIQIMTLESYNKLSKTSKIGIKKPIYKGPNDIGPCLDIKLKPPKISLKSKKLYKDVFIRSLKKDTVHHLYTLNGLYIVSFYKSKDKVYKWIDENINTIKERENELH